MLSMPACVARWLAEALMPGTLREGLVMAISMKCEYFCCPHSTTHLHWKHHKHRRWVPMSSQSRKDATLAMLP